MALQLGDFSDELRVQEQDTLVDVLVKSVPEFFDASVPRTYKQALRHDQLNKWMEAIQEELRNLERLGVWEIRPIPKGVSVLRAKWVFAVKTNASGEVDRYKAQYVAKGFTQIAGENFNRTFAPTAMFMSMRIILSVAAINGWPVHCFDFVAAYLNSPINKEVWVAAPEGLTVAPVTACLLKKALYGTKQAGRCWWKHLAATLSNLGYLSSQYDGSVYILSRPEGNIVIWIHVDDGIVTGPSDKAIKNLERELSSSLQVKWAACLEDIVGLRVKRIIGGFELSQPRLISKILSEHWDGVSHAKTPLPCGSLPTTCEDGEGLRSVKYLLIIGSLSYLSAGLRPNLTFAVNFLARFSKCPGESHWKCLHNLINYLAGSKTRPLILKPVPDSPKLSCFTNANWGGEFSCSTYGFIIFLHGSPISWNSRRLATFASSTAHAEYMALGHGTKQLLWLQHLFKDITGIDTTGRLYCDNQAAIKVCSDDVSNKRTRHTDREFYITNQALFRNQVSLSWVDSKHQFADVFTKNLTPLIHDFQLKTIMGVLLSGGVL
jgi:hypothetical protein